MSDRLSISAPSDLFSNRARGSSRKDADGAVFGEDVRLGPSEEATWWRFLASRSSISRCGWCQYSSAQYSPCYFLREIETRKQSGWKTETRNAKSGRPINQQDKLTWITLKNHQFPMETGIFREMFGYSKRYLRTSYAKRNISAAGIIIEITVPNARFHRCHLNCFRKVLERACAALHQCDCMLA